MRQYQQVTDRIIAMLEAGTRPWAQGWNAPAGGGRPLRVDGQAYRGANVLNLWAAAMERGFASPFWMTYKAAQERGGQVKKGAKAESAFYVGTINRTEENTKGEEVERVIPFLKAYCVFNADEIEGLPAHFYAKAADHVPLAEGARIPAADKFIAATGAVVRHGGGRAFYRPSADEIHLPEFASFLSVEEYYSVTFHELTHWTGAEKRLDRLSKSAHFGNPEYAFDELVAELGAAYLCADLAVANEPREDHASYIAGWIKALKEDNRAIFRAASLAEKAAGYLHAAADADEERIAA